MSADRLPARPNLDHLKRQAKELQKEQGGRLRDAQRAIAEKYGFASWDALRVRVKGATVSAATGPGIDYEHFVPDTIVLRGPLTREVAARLVADGVTGITVDPSIPLDALTHLTEISSLQRLDLSELNDLSDNDLSFLEGMSGLTAVAFARWGRVGDRAVAALAGKPRLSRLVLGPGLTDAGVERLRDFPALAVPVAADALLSISSARTLTDRALAAVGTLQGVVQLDVHCSAFGSPYYTAEGVSHLKRMRALESLNFHGQLVTDAVLREIAAIPSLRWLHSQDIISGDEGFNALGQCRTLEALAARLCHNVTDRGVAPLAGLPRLTSLNIGGRRLTDDALAPFAAAQALTDLSSPLSRDGAFLHIAKMPKLERLVNMYNRATTDAATQHLEHHATLRHYAAFGTQITDESLRILAGLPVLDSVELDNLQGITDEGLRSLVRAPRLRRLSVDVCMRVSGDWVKSAPATVDARFHAGDRAYAEFYRAETLMDHPDLPMPPDVAAPEGMPTPEIAVPLGCVGGRPAFGPDGLYLPMEPVTNPQRIGVITRDAVAAPMTIDLVVRPLTELRIVFGAHNKYIAFNDRGDVVDVAPWFLRLDAENGKASGEGTAIASDQWTRVTLEVDDHEKRVRIDGQLRHRWQGDFTGFRSRLACGPRKSGLTVRKLTIVSG